MFAMAWFTRQKSGAEAADNEERRVRTEGLWLKCESCSQLIWKKALDDNLQCCPQCNHHFRLGARARLATLFDGQYLEFDAGLISSDPLKFEDSKKYAERLIHASRDQVIRCADLRFRDARWAP